MRNFQMNANPPSPRAGSYVPAERMDLGIHDAILTRMGVNISGVTIVALLIHSGRHRMTWRRGGPLLWWKYPRLAK